ncbi:7452_t:CDS:2, partial [Funneliformis caledonium]
MLIAYNTSINTQAASSTVPEPSAQAADISINTQAVSGIDTISTLQDNDKFKEVVNSSPTDIIKKTQSHNNPAIKLQPSNDTLITPMQSNDEKEAKNFLMK